VVKGVGEFDAQGAGHDEVQIRLNAKIKDLTPFLPDKRVIDGLLQMLHNDHSKYLTAGKATPAGLTRGSSLGGYLE
jgi:hypothetical protein